MHAVQRLQGLRGVALVTTTAIAPAGSRLLALALPKAEKRHPSEPDKCLERERLALRALDGASYKEKGIDALKGSVIPA